MVGTLIRQLRIERNYSQAGLAQGICAPSYLSKIEQGQAAAGTDILEKLFAALGVEYCQDEALLQNAEEWLARYLESRDQQNVEQTAADWLDQRLEQLQCSRLNLWMGIYHLCRMLDAADRISAKQLLNSLKHMQLQMDSKQQYRYFLCAAEISEDPSEALQMIEQAANRCNCAYIQWAKSYVCFHMGQYSRCMETAERAYSMAAEEGDLYVLMWSSFLYGSCCTDRDLVLAEKYYRRAIRLSRTAFPHLEDLAAYNLGASYLECGKLEQAQYWLERAGEVPEEMHHNFLLHQKRAIVYAILGRKEAGMQELETAHAMAENLTDVAFFGDMLTFAELLLRECSQTPEFEMVTRRLYDQAGAKWGFGFRKFYGRYLVNYYRSQRRYKDALGVMEALEEKIPE